MAERYIYENGLTLVCEHIPFLHSIACGAWVGAGCCYEDTKNNGISHFIEHMLFKGTTTRNSFQIADSFERLGAYVNAFTAKDATCYHYKSIDENNEKCFEILADMFLNSTFDEQEMAREKGVVQEEINMVEDAPEDLCFDLLASAVHGNRTLAQTILGSTQNVQSFTKEGIESYMRKSYNPANTVISFSGNITLQQARELVEKYLLKGIKYSGNKLIAPAFIAENSKFLYKISDFEQANIALRFDGCSITDSKSAAFSLLHFILGASMSSRLFQSLREKLGLAYSIFTSVSAHKNGGSFVIFYNVNPQNAAKATQAIRRELESICQSITDDEFERAKTQIKCALVFAQESVQSTMIALGKYALIAEGVYNPEKKIAEINCATKKDVLDLAQQIFKFDRACGAYVGKDVQLDIGGILK